MKAIKNIPKMLLIGAAEKNSGKTGLSVKIIKHFCNSQKIYAVKGTVLRDFEGRKGFSISEETNSSREKDTGRLLAAGAEKVYWLKTDEEHAEEGIMEVIKKIPSDAYIICESNTIRKYIKPGLFLMVKRENPVGIKKTAEEVMKYVDRLIISKKENDEIIYEPDVIKLLTLRENGWILDA